MAGKPGKSGGARQGAGRKAKAVEDDLHERLGKALRDGRKSRLDQIFSQLVTDALSQSFTVRHKARTQLLAYLYGTPVPRKEMEGDDGADLAPPIADTIERVYGDDGETDPGDGAAGAGG